MKQEFLSNIKGHIRKLILTAWLLLVVTLVLATTSVQAQGGCPAVPNQALGVEPTVIEALPLSPYIPEAPSTQLNESFYTTTLEFEYDPLSARILLAGSPDGQGQLCADDLIVLTSQDWAFKVDTRTSDRQRIVTTAPIDISHVFSAGRNQLRLELVDLSPDFYSASPIWLVMVEVQTPVIVLTATETPIPTPTPTPEPTATTDPTATAEPGLLTVTPSISNSVIHDVEAPTIVSAESSGTAKPSLTSWLSWWWLSLLTLAGLLLLLLGWRRRSRRLVPPGQITIFADKQMVQTWDLATWGKAVVTLGGQGADVVLPDGTAPSVVARIVARATPDGRTQAIWERLDPNDSAVVLEHQILVHGDELLVVNQIRLEYSHYQVETETFLEGEFSHV